MNDEACRPLLLKANIEWLAWGVGRTTGKFTAPRARAVRSWKVGVRTSLGVALLLLAVAALSIPQTTPGGLATFAGGTHRAAPNPHPAFTLNAFNNESVDYILGPVLPYLRAGDTIDLGNDTKENQTNVILLNAWARELHARLPPGVNITARVENLSNIQEAAQNLSPLFNGITLDYEKNRTFIPNWTYNFSAALDYFRQANASAQSYIRATIAYPTGIPLNQSYGWNYATIAKITGLEDVQTQGFAIPSKWSPVITKLVGQFANTSVSLDRLGVQITLGPHIGGTPGNSQDAANATSDINFAWNDSLRSIYLWWGLNAPSESFLLRVLETFRTALWPVNFSESNLPLGTNWSVHLTNGSTLSTNGSMVNFFEPNGSYSFVAWSTNSYYASMRGSFEIEGMAVSQPLIFAPTTYPISFAEGGLPHDAHWYVNLSGGSSNSSTGPTLNFRESNGTYDYQVATSDSEYHPVTPGNSFQVNGSSKEINVTFNLTAYAVTIFEYGLAAGTNWSISIGPNTFNSSTGVIQFNEPNGSYRYSIAGPTDYLAGPSSGTFSLEGSAVYLNIAFVKLHMVTFAESGLPIGMSWSVTVNGTSEASTSTLVTFMELNGSYSFSIGSAPGFGPDPANGSFSVHGDSYTLNVSYLKTYLLTFSENTLPVNSNWSISLTGASNYVILSGPFRTEMTTLTRWSDGASIIMFYVSAGNYTYAASAVGELNLTGSLVVGTQNPPNVPVPFPSGSFSSPRHGLAPSIFPGLSNLGAALIIGAAVVAAAVAVLVLLTRRRRPESPNTSGDPSAETEDDDVWSHP